MQCGDMENSLGIACACGPVGKIILTKHFFYAKEIADYFVHKKIKRISINKAKNVGKQSKIFTEIAWDFIYGFYINGNQLTKRIS